MTISQKIIYKIKQLFKGYILRNSDDLLALEYIKQDKRHDFRHRYDIASDDIVFDLGAYKGDWTKKIISMYPSCKVHLFELLPKYAKNLTSKFKNTDNLVINNFGLSDSLQDVYISEDGLGSSAVSHSSDKQLYVGILRDFKEYVNSHSINAIKLMKMNIEGGEYELLEYLIEINWIESIENLQIQFHNYGEEYVNRRDKIRAQLSKTHHLTYDYAWTFENWKKN